MNDESRGLWRPRFFFWMVLVLGVQAVVRGRGSKASPAGTIPLMATVYIETTIPSFYYESRPGVQLRAWRDATRLWWTTARPRHRCVTSEFVFSELRRTPGAKGVSAVAL